MGKQFAVLHIEKGKSSGGGLGNHIDRVEGMEHTYKHADKEQTHRNIDFLKSELTIPQAIEKRISEGYTKKTAIRKDAVKYLSTVLTGSHEQMKEIFSKSETANKWIQKNIDFAIKEFGKDNIIRFTLHLDEKTPHIHLVTVPITKDGGLSARQYIGSRKQLSSMQDRYAEQMAEFGLGRGVKNTGIKHDTAKDYYRRIQMSINEVENLTVKGVFGIKKEQTIENLQNALKTHIFDLREEKRARKNDGKALGMQNLSYQLENGKLNRQLQKTKNSLKTAEQDLNFILASPENREVFIDNMAMKMLEEQEKRLKKAKDNSLTARMKRAKSQERKRGRGFSM